MQNTIHDNKKLARNIWIIYSFNFLKGLMFFLPIYALYLKSELFTAVNVALIITIQAIFKTIFEVPSGAFADLFGRKKTIIYSGSISVIALVFLGIGTSLYFFIIYAILNALAESLVSGTDTAILFDSLNVLKKKSNFQKIISWNIGMWQIGATLSSIVGGLLAVYSLKLPVFMTIIPFSIAFFITFLLVEPPYKKETHKNIFLQMKNSLKVILNNNQLIILLLTSVLFFTFCEVAFQFNPIFYNFKNIPIAYFGIASALGFGLSFLGSILSSHYLSKKIGDKKTLLISAILSPILLFFATISSGLFVLLFIILGSFIFGIRLPGMVDLYNKKLESKHRATILSIGNLASILGLAMFAPIFGYIADIFNINIAFKIAALLSCSAIILILFIKEK